MVTSMLDKNLSSILPAPLIGFTQNRIEWFLLSTSYVETRDCHRYNAFKSLYAIVTLERKIEINWYETPPIAYSLYHRSRLENSDGQRDRNYVLALKQLLPGLSHQIEN